MSAKGPVASLNLTVSPVVLPWPGSKTFIKLLPASCVKGFNPNNLSVAGSTLAGLACSNAWIVTGKL